MSVPQGWELVLVVLVIMVLFGAKRLPDASRSLGRSMRIFKAETKGLRDDDVKDGAVPTTTYPTGPVAGATPVPPPAPIPAPTYIPAPQPLDAPAPLLPPTEQSQRP